MTQFKKEQAILDRGIKRIQDKNNLTSIKYKTLESFSINKHHTTTSYKIFCGKQSSSADSYVTYLDPITMLRNIEGKKTTIFKLEYLLLRLI